MAPQFKGALTIYNMVLKPILDANKDRIADLIKQSTDAAADMQKSAKADLAKAAT